MEETGEQFIIKNIYSDDGLAHIFAKYNTRSVYIDAKCNGYYWCDEKKLWIRGCETVISKC
jgi:hypothetical protein